MHVRRSRARLSAAAAIAVVVAIPGAARADHTDPNAPLQPVVNKGPQAITSGEGSWQHVASFGGLGLTGTDLKPFHRGGSVYVAGGSLGQTQLTSIGQRIVRLTNADGEVEPELVADHGSAYCPDVSNISGTTGLQHDAAVTPRAYGTDFLEPGAKPDAELLIDSTDGVGRCHDSSVGGLELIDVSGLGADGFEPREVHLTRHTGYSHTVTVDATRPWLVYNSTSDFGTDSVDDANPQGIGKAWLDVLDVRSCLGLAGRTLEQKRAACRPDVFRIPFKYEWSVQETEDGTRQQPSACHDITARPGRIYCAALNGTIAFDVSGLTQAQGPDIPALDDPAGDIRGRPLPCEVVEAVPAQGVSGTGAAVTDCTLGVPNDTALAVAAYEESGRPQASGWRYLGHVNHVGRNCGSHGTYTCNTNVVTPADEGVAVSHEADPTPDGRYLFVTDERGGGIVPSGATCVNSVENPTGNGGLHVFDTSARDASGRFTYAKTPSGEKAVFISRNVLFSPTFCTIHVIEQIPDERRIVAAWYSQGVKIVDYDIDANGRWTFRETAGYALLPNDIWAAEVFKIDTNADGTRTYWFVSSDISRGIDVFSWTAKPHGLMSGEPAPAPARPAPRAAPLPATGGHQTWWLLAVPVVLLLRRRWLSV